jgi:hypothetical protein
VVQKESANGMLYTLDYDIAFDVKNNKKNIKIKGMNFLT